MLAIAGGGAAAWKLGLLQGVGPQPVTRARVLMGTELRLTVISGDREAAVAAAEATLRRMSGLEALLSRYLPASEVSRLNADGHLSGASTHLREVLRLASVTSEMTGGAFDVTIQPVLDVYRAHLAQGSVAGDRHALLARLGPALEEARAHVDYRAVRVDGDAVSLGRPGMRLTLDGIGKGYIVDHGVSELVSRGFRQVLVDAGGDLVAAGERERGTPWRIGIRHPRPRGLAMSARCDLSNRAIATSGDYLQPFTRDLGMHHIVDPRTGWSSPELASATVIAPDAATADALATVCMVLGPRRGRDLLEELPACEGYFIGKDLQTVRTTGFDLV